MVVLRVISLISVLLFGVVFAFARDVSHPNLVVAVEDLEQQIAALMAETGIPGLAVAVVEGDAVVFAKGFGVSNLDDPKAITADTVFQLASVSKAIGATVVASAVDAGEVNWQTRVREIVPEFALSDPYVAEALTIGDLYAHRRACPITREMISSSSGLTKRRFSAGCVCFLWVHSVRTMPTPITG